MSYDGQARLPWLPLPYMVISYDGAVINILVSMVTATVQ